MGVRGPDEGILLRTAPDSEAAQVVVRGADAGEPYEMPSLVGQGIVVAIVEETEDTDGARWVRVVAPVAEQHVEDASVGWLRVDDDPGAPVLPLEAPGAPACPDVDDVGRVEAWPRANPFLAVTCLDGSQVALHGELTAAVPCESQEWLRCAVFRVGGVEVFAPKLLRAIAPGTTVVVTGHVDDPEAAQCHSEAGDPTESIAVVFACRSHLVADQLATPADVHRPAGPVVPEVTIESVTPYADDEWVRFTLRVTNASDYPAELFAAAPGLASCGAIDPAARAWVDILSSEGDRLARFCKPGDGSILSALSFGVPADAADPGPVFVEIHDRLDDVRFRSTLVPLDR